MKRDNRIYWWSTSLALLLCQLGALAGELRGTEQALLSGKVEYSGAQAIAPGAVARIILQDVSLADASAPVITELRIDSPTSFPIAFELAYRPAQIKQAHRYSVMVRIETEGRLDYINDTTIPVITQQHPTEGVRVPVIRVQRAQTMSVPGNSNGLANTSGRPLVARR